MKYFGQKSLSSVLLRILQVSWYVVLIGSIAGAIAMGIFIFLLLHRGDTASAFAGCLSDLSAKDLKDWNTFLSLPLFVRLIVIPYFAAVVILLLMIIKKSQQIFINFKNDVVFNKKNVEIISKINKLLIAFSIITFNFSALLVCVLLLLLCEIIKNGTVLQEEHDLTV